jgi:hypothetical protein
MSDHGHGDKGGGKKGERQEKLRRASLVAAGAAIGFMHAASTIYLREIYNIKSLLPAWGLKASDYMANYGDFAILTRNVALKILVDNNLLVMEQTRQVATLLILVALVYLVGKDPKERMSLFMFVGGIAGVLYHAFLYALLHWPTSLSDKDVILLVPNPVIAPTYIPLLVSGLALGGGFFLLFKKKSSSGGHH